MVIVLAELGLGYEAKYLVFNKDEHEAQEHTKYNPNGRIPTLIDHANDNFVIWSERDPHALRCPGCSGSAHSGYHCRESNAIIAYLVEKYDAECEIPVNDTDEHWWQLQWLFLQASGQG